MVDRLYEKYKKEVVPELMSELSLKNVMQVPGLKKVVLNAGIGSFREDKPAVDSFVEEFSLIAGQRPSVRKARLSEAGFKIKKGDIVGLAVTLRGKRMWAFLDKLINIILPRVRDFKGVDRDSFDGKGNYSIGLSEHTLFPEVNPNTVKGIRNLEVTIVTSSKNKGESEKLLSKLGLPFKKEA